MPSIVDIYRGAYPSAKETPGGDTRRFSVCPWCGQGDDRFRIWEDQGRYLCNKCGERGDTIDLVRRIRGLSFREAKAVVEGNSHSQVLFLKQQEKVAQREKPAAKAHVYDWDAFDDACEVFLRSCIGQLDSREAKAFFDSRCLMRDTAWNWRLSWNATLARGYYRDWGMVAPEGKDFFYLPPGCVLPKFHWLKERPASARCDEWERYIWIRGAEIRCYPLWQDKIAHKFIVPACFVHVPPDARLCVVVESHLDAVLMLQESAGSVAVVATGGAYMPLDPYARECADPFYGAGKLVLCPDGDAGGDSALERWRQTYPQAHVIRSIGGKDLTDAERAARAGTKGAMCVRAWLEAVARRLERLAEKGVPPSFSVGREVSRTA